MQFKEMWFDLQGTCNRTEYWLSGTIPLIAIAAFGPIMWYSFALSAEISRETYYSGMRIIIGTDFILLLWPYCAIHLKRTRDIGNSRICMLPVIPLVWLLWYITPGIIPAAAGILGFLPSKKGQGKS